MMVAVALICLWKGACMVQADGHGMIHELAPLRQRDDSWQHQDSADALQSAGDAELLSVKLSLPLPCGMAGCHRPTTLALVERDAESFGLWRLLPICPTCAENLSADAAQSVGAR